MSASDTIEDPDRGLREWLRHYARQHPRWGHRRAYHDARAQGWVVNHKVTGQVVAGSQGWPSASMTKVSKKFRPCLAAVDR